MFNDKTNKRKEKLTAVFTGAAVIAMAATFGYATVANAQIQASVSKPALRTEYKSSEMINLAGEVDLRNGDKTISISLRDSDLKPALRMIADKAGLNIIFHNSVSGSVTLDLVNVTLNDAFKMIMQACDLSYMIEDGTLIVMSKDAALTSDIGKQNMMTIPVKYADSAKIADFLNNNIFSTNRPGLSNSKIAVTNSVTNELVLFGTINDYKMAQKIVSKLDVAPKTTSYRVNHTTPKEMATLICQSLFPTAKMGEGASGSGSGAGASSESSSGDGMVTGGASSIGSGSGGSGGSGGSSGSSSGSSGGSSSDDEEITLGEGKVACTVNGEVTTGGNLKSLSGSSLTVTYFPQKGTVNIVGGSDAQAEMIKAFINDNDKKQPQAYVEMQIVELSENGAKEFNNTWTLMTPFFAGTFGGSGVSNFSQNPMFISGRPYGIDTIDSESGAVKASNSYDRFHGHKTLTWSINYLITQGKGRILANPKLLVTNGKKSIINLTSDYIKSTDEEIMTSAGGTGVVGISRTYEIGDDCGILVEMTPFISPDGYVTMNLKPDYSTIQPDGKVYSESANVNGPRILAATLLQRRNLELSNIRIKDGETLVIGGLIQEQESKVIGKTPILGDLPVIGSLFRSTRTENVKNELVIMVTPHIVKDTEDSVASTENL